MTLTLDQLVESGIKHAKHILLKKRERELTPFYTLITAKNEVVVLGCSYRNEDEKMATVAVIHAEAALRNAVQCLFVSEGWMLELPKPLSPWHAKQQIENLPIPSQSPDRIEIVQSIATDGTRTKSRRLQMVRDKPGGKLIALVPLPDIDHMVSGRMIDGIIPPRKET
jgi:hypothetical protein